MTADTSIPANAKAVVAEVAAAVERFITGGQGWTIYIDKMGLSPADRQAIRDLLGEGGLRISLENSAEPAEWLESGVSGVWYGVYYDQSRQRPLLETIEVGAFPAVAAAQTEDIAAGLEGLRRQLAEI